MCAPAFRQIVEGVPFTSIGTELDQRFRGFRQGDGFGGPLEFRRPPQGRARGCARGAAPVVDVSVAQTVSRGIGVGIGAPLLNEGKLCSASNDGCVPPPRGFMDRRDIDVLGVADRAKEASRLAHVRDGGVRGRRTVARARRLAARPAIGRDARSASAGLCWAGARITGKGFNTLQGAIILEVVPGRGRVDGRAPPPTEDKHFVRRRVRAGGGRIHGRVAHPGHPQLVLFPLGTLP